MAAIDFSLQNRIPDGNGKLLVGDLSPTDGSYTTESQYKTWIQQDILDGTITAKKAECDQNSNVIDTTYETKAEATELKNAIQSNTARIENLEQEHGGLVPVQYRGTNAVPTGKAKYAMVETIVGKSRGWNNICRNGNFPNTDNWSQGIFFPSTLSASNNVLTITSGGDVANGYTSISFINGHKYLLCFDTRTDSTLVNGSAYFTSESLVSITTTSSWTTHTAIITAGSTDVRFGIFAQGASVSIQVRKVIIRDLTLIFPEGVPSTVAECVQKCPDILKYDSYGYSLVDTVVEGVRSVGVNIWDEEWDNGYLWAGSPASGTNVRSENYIEVKPNTTYYLCTTAIINISFYDASKNSLSSGTGTQLGAGQTFTTDADTHYIKFFMDSAYGSSYGNNIQIADNNSSTKTTHHAWVNPSTLSLPTPVTLRSAGSGVNEVRDELDVESGVPTENVLRVNLGDLDWRGSSTEFYANVPNAVLKTEAPSTCGRYVEASSYSSMAQGSYYVINGYISTGSVALIIKDSSYSTYSDFKIAMNGVYFNIEKATPTTGTSIGTSNPMIQTEGGGTINTQQTQTPVIDNCMDVAYLAL